MRGKFGLDITPDSAPLTLLPQSVKENSCRVKFLDMALLPKKYMNIINTVQKNDMQSLSMLNNLEYFYRLTNRFQTTFKIILFSGSKISFI